MKSRGRVICTNLSPNSSSPSVVAFVLSWVYSSSRPRNRGGHVVVLSKLAFTTDAEAHGGIGGNMLMTLPLNWSVGSAVVVSGLLKSHTTSLTRLLLSSCCGQFSLRACRPGSCASRFPHPLDQQLPVPPCSSFAESSSYNTGAFHSCHFVHSNPAHLSNHVNSSPIVFITTLLSSLLTCYQTDLIMELLSANLLQGT